MPSLYLVRHAQASFGRSDYDQLSPQGERQATVLGQALAARGIRPDLVVTGGMRRHIHTAELALAAAGLSGETEVDRAFDEFDHEQVIAAHKPAYRVRPVMLADLARTGRPQQAFQRMFAEATERWTRGGDGYTESFATFGRRCVDATDRVAARLGQGETGLVFTSGGPIAAVVSRLWSGGDELWLRLNPVTVNTAITKLVSGRGGLTVVSYNEHGHLDGTDLFSYR